MKISDLFNVQKRVHSWRKLNQIEAEMQNIGRWRESTKGLRGKGFRDSPSFQLWLQCTFIPNARKAAITGLYPKNSQVAVLAIREFDGCENTDRLISLLSEFDAIGTS